MDVIVAVDRNWGIGKNGTQHVVLSADRKFFRNVTSGGAVIVGRKTLADFSGGRPLAGRINIVISSDTGLKIDGAVIVHSLAELFLELEKINTDKVLVIGGGSVYQTLLPYCRYAYITKIDVLEDADTFFPNLDDDINWTLCDTGEEQTENGIAYSFVRYENNMPLIWQGE